jgi:type II secretion system (T2SS) protein F
MTLTAMAALVIGGVAGLGLFLIVRGGVAASPDLAAALGHLHPAPRVQRRGLAAAAAARIRVPAEELRLIGQSTERYAIEKILFAFAGLLVPAMFSAALALMGMSLSWGVPMVVSIAMSVGFFVLADVNVRQKANAAREDFRRAIAVYLSLVALVRYSGAGAVESLERAALVGTGWVFERIRSALAEARYANEAPWDRLRELSIELGVPDLGEVGEIMSLAGDQGAQVYQTLLSRATSLRVAMRTKEQQRAALSTTLMYIPTTILLFVFLILIGYPALGRITG